ncbi:MAG: hypothetical protein GZ094_19465 [Mariniphaga sp.]|nr:hypothetical protein [Mariniphaga sp.]
MNKLVMVGTIVVFFALTFYSIGIYAEQKHKKVLQRVITFLTMGIIADIIATAFMIAGSSKGLFTFHGILGYSALLAMLIDNIFIWRLRLKTGVGADVPDAIHRYSRFAYIWWVIAFITGGLLVAYSKMG